MLKNVVVGVILLGVLLYCLFVRVANSPSMQKNTLAYESWPTLRLAGAYWESKGEMPKSIEDLLDYSRDKGTEDAKRVENYIKLYDPILMIRWSDEKKRKAEDGFIGDLWIKPTQNCAPGWISVKESGNDLSPNQHPPADAVYLWVPGSPKP